MDISVLYLTKFTNEGDFMSIFVGEDEETVLKLALSSYDIDITCKEVFEGLDDRPGVQIGSWSFEFGHLGDNAELILRMSSVEASDMWRGEDGDV